MTRLSSWEVAVLLLDCAYNAVDHDGDLTINRKCVVPGDISWDSCQCGQLVVAEQRRYPSTNFPTDEIDHDAECGAGWLVIPYVISLARCVPIPDENGNPPACEALQASAQQLNRDMGLLRSALECCLNAAYDADTIVAYSLGAQEINGPQGGCVETSFTVMVGFLNGCGCGN